MQLQRLQRQRSRSEAAQPAADWLVACRNKQRRFPFLKKPYKLVLANYVTGAWVRNSNCKASGTEPRTFGSLCAASKTSENFCSNSFAALYCKRCSDAALLQPLPTKPLPFSPQSEGNFRLHSSTRSCFQAESTFHLHFMERSVLEQLKCYPAPK